MSYKQDCNTTKISSFNYDLLSPFLFLFWSVSLCLKLETKTLQSHVLILIYQQQQNINDPNLLKLFVRIFDRNERQKNISTIQNRNAISNLTSSSTSFTLFLLSFSSYPKYVFYICIFSYKKKVRRMKQSC